MRLSQRLHTRVPGCVFIVISVIAGLNEPANADGPISITVVESPPSNLPIAGVKVCLFNRVDISEVVQHQVTGDTAPDLGIARFDGDPPGTGA